MKKCLLTLVSAMALWFSAGATTCPNAQVIPAGQTLPYTVSSMVCGTTNDITAAVISPLSTYYLGGTESVYTWTPSASFTNVSISYSGQSYSSIYLFQGCPTTGGTFIGALETSGNSKVFNLNNMTLGGIVTTTPSNGVNSYNILQGVQYYIVFDTWPSPASPCTGTFTINGTQMSGCTNPITAGNTLSTVPTACSATNFTLSLSNFANLNLMGGVSYQWQLSTNGGTTWTDIANATAPSAVVNQTAARDYRCRVTCSGGTPTYSTVLNVPMNTFINCYCTSSPSNTYSYVNIFNVELTSLNNSSTCSSLAPGPGSVMAQYSNYTTLAPASIMQGTTHTLNVTMGTCSGAYSNYTKAWIDFNQDGNFDPVTELVLSQGGTGAFFASNSFVVPNNAVLGQTRMRIIASETSSAGNVTPCGNASYYYGETEDYIVTIAGPPTCLQPSNLLVSASTNTTADINWVANSGATNFVVYYFPTTSTLANAMTQVVNGATSTQLTGLTANSFYHVRVKAVCSPTDTSYYSTNATFNTYGVGTYIESDAACGAGFQSLMGNPTKTNLNLGDDNSATITLPFPVYYQGQAFMSMSVSSNGGILLGSSNTLYSTMDLSANGLYPYLQDLNAGSAGAGVYWDVVGTAPNRKLLVEWNQVPHYGQSNGSTFQVAYEEATKEIYFYYDDVDHANASYDFGGDAEIGVSGPTDILISMNNATYLQNNSCIHYYYTYCPNPINLVVNNISNTGAVASWSAGVANESSWAIEYGPAGFTPGTGTMVQNLTSPTYTLANLNDVTLYDIYVYSDCAAGVVSLGLTSSFWTLPDCSNPTAITATTGQDLINATWSWLPAVAPVTSFNIKYTNSYGVIVGVQNTNSPNFNGMVQDTTLMSGGVYSVYVQAVCPNDTSNYVGPVQVIMPLQNDAVCDAQFLPVDGVNRWFNGQGATVQPGEAVLEQAVAGAQSTNGWANSQITHSVWYKFTAPASGKLRVNATGINVDGQIAIYSAISCTDFATFTFVAGNDDDLTSASLSPNFTICNLNPGQTYFMVYDPRSTSAPITNYNLKLTDIQYNTGTATAQASICTGADIDLFTTLNGQDSNGFWVDPINTGKLTDNMFSSPGLAYQTFNFYYKIVDGCYADSTLTQVKVYGPSSAGVGTSITACKNQPINLLSGLSGNVDMGGTWNDPSGAVLSGPSVTSAPVASQSNYTYITSNGVCPADTSTVMVNVINTCDFLSINDLELEGMEMYPNPTDGFTTITYVGASSDVYSYQVTDLNGRVIAQDSNAISSAKSTQVDMRGKEAGVYMIRVFNDSNSKIFKLMVK